MSLKLEYVQKLFNKLQNGKSNEFFKYVAPDVDWTIMGTHPLSGTYKSREDFIEKTFARLNKILNEGVVLKVNNILISKNTAVVEMESLSTAKNGMVFSNTYCWIVEFKEKIIIRVRAYVDSTLVQRLIDENEK